MKFGQLIGYDMKDPECDGGSVPRPFSKKSKLSISLDHQSTFIQFVFIVWKVEGYRNILKLSCRPLAFTSYNVF